MVEEAKWMLRNLDSVDPLTVAKAFDCTEDECWEYIAVCNRVPDEAVASYDPLAIQKAVSEWVETIPDRNNILIEAIKGQLMDAKENPENHDVNKLLFKVEVLKGTAERPSPEMIARAKEYPLGTLLNAHGKKGNISCPFHKDKNPSFQIKKDNTFTCYSCGEYGDSLDLYQKIHRVGFIEAVKALS